MKMTEGERKGRREHDGVEDRTWKRGKMEEKMKKRRKESRKKDERRSRMKSIR